MRHQRYVLYSTIAACLLSAAGFERIADAAVRAARRAPTARSVAAALAVGLAVVVATLQAGDQRFFRTPASRPEDYGAASAFVHAHRSPGDAVLFEQSSARNADLGYPSDFAGLRDIAERVTPARSGTFRGIDRPVAQVLTSLEASTRVWVLDKAPLASEPRDLPGSRALLARHFYAATIARFRGVVDVLFVQKSTPPHP